MIDDDATEALDLVETTVLAHAASDRFAREYAIQHIDAEAFTSMATGHVWAAIVRRHANGLPVSIDLIVAEGEVSPELARAVTRASAGLADTEAVDLLRERVQRRRIAAAARGLANDAEKPDVPLERLSQWAVANLRLPTLRLPDPLMNLDALAAKYADMPYDWLMGDVLERRDRLILIAREGIGKSTMLRQFAYQGAAGVNWTRPSRRCEPFKTVIVDAENSERQTARAVGRLMYCARKAGGYNPDFVKPIYEPRLDLTSPVWRERVEGHLEIEQPDLLIVGPIYKVFATNSKLNYEENALRAIGVLDEWRERFGVTILLEHHAPKGEGLDPRGSAAWLGYPEFGRTLQYDKDQDAFKFGRFRFDRDVRDWPTWWYYNENPTGWPWVPCHDDDPPPVGRRGVEVPRFETVRGEPRSFAEPADNEPF